MNRAAVRAGRTAAASEQTLTAPVAILRILWAGAAQVVREARAVVEPGEATAARP